MNKRIQRLIFLDKNRGSESNSVIGNDGSSRCYRTSLPRTFIPSLTLSSVLFFFFNRSDSFHYSPFFIHHFRPSIILWNKQCTQCSSFNQSKLPSHQLTIFHYIPFRSQINPTQKFDWQHPTINPLQYCQQHKISKATKFRNIKSGH